MTDIFTPIKVLNVSLNIGSRLIEVGRLARREGKIYFEYDAAFLSQGLVISPFHLPQNAGLQVFEPRLFEGLPGVFNDSLPDGWGRLLLDRALRGKGISERAMTPLDRLAHVGHSGMGALVYEPDYSDSRLEGNVDLDLLAAESKITLEGESSHVLDELIALNGSSAGARPKALIGVSRDKSKIIEGVYNLFKDHEPWLVKFPNNQDGSDAGAIEYVYALMAHEAGLEMMDVHLFPAKNSPGHFSTKRFDRTHEGGRLHLHTACGLLHSDFRVPSLDYQDLIQATLVLTRDVREAQKMFRLAVFNVLSHNRDDHSKNVSFLMDETGAWRLAPAYDLTFSSGPGGEQSTLIMGEGKTPGKAHLLKLGKKAQLSQQEVKKIIDQTVTALQQWRVLAKAHGVSEENIKRIGSIVNE